MNNILESKPMNPLFEHKQSISDVVFSENTDAISFRMKMKPFNDCKGLFSDQTENNSQKRKEPNLLSLTEQESIKDEDEGKIGNIESDHKNILQNLLQNYSMKNDLKQMCFECNYQICQCQRLEHLNPNGDSGILFTQASQISNEIQKDGGPDNSYQIQKMCKRIGVANIKVLENYEQASMRNRDPPLYDTLMQMSKKIGSIQSQRYNQIIGLADKTPESLNSGTFNQKRFQQQDLIFKIVNNIQQYVDDINQRHQQDHVNLKDAFSQSIQQNQQQIIQQKIEQPDQISQDSLSSLNSDQELELILQNAEIKLKNVQQNEQTEKKLRKNFNLKYIKNYRKEPIKYYDDEKMFDKSNQYFQLNKQIEIIQGSPKSQNSINFVHSPSDISSNNIELQNEQIMWHANQNIDAGIFKNANHQQILETQNQKQESSSQASINPTQIINNNQQFEEISHQKNILNGIYQYLQKLVKIFNESSLNCSQCINQTLQSERLSQNCQNIETLRPESNNITLLKSLVNQNQKYRDQIDILSKQLHQSRIQNSELKVNIMSLNKELQNNRLLSSKQQNIASEIQNNANQFIMSKDQEIQNLKILNESLQRSLQKIQIKIDNSNQQTSDQIENISFSKQEEQNISFSNIQKKENDEDQKQYIISLEQKLIEQNPFNMNVINEDRNLILDNLKVIIKNKEDKGLDEDLKDQIQDLLEIEKQLKNILDKSHIYKQIINFPQFETPIKYEKPDINFKQIFKKYEQNHQDKQ